MKLVRYGVFGVLTTLVNFSVFWLLSGIIGLPVDPSNAIAIVTSVFFAYVANKLFVFKSHVGSARALFAEALTFFSSRAVTMLIEFFGVMCFSTYLGYPATPVKLIANVLVIVLNFVFSQWIVFRKRS
ncbi:GtrA family protein [Oscillospiraceae bacterium OttesenSCG-928-G22]|nr:GtrA family protein [Oscillospiraceae bacterium OttesenSCG-928-G22]